MKESNGTKVFKFLKLNKQFDRILLKLYSCLFIEIERLLSLCVCAWKSIAYLLATRKHILP